MARYTGPKRRLERRAGMDLELKSKRSGKRSRTNKDAPPGQHGQRRTRRPSEFGLQLREKQKVRLYYGVLEKQFRGYYEEAVAKPGKTGEVLLQILESRLDNVVYRAGFAQSRDMARQLVTHGHIQVNGKKVTIPSYRVREHDIISVRDKSKELTPFLVAQGLAGSRSVPAWLEVIPSDLKVLVHSLPARQVIDTQVQEQLIVELYSK